MNRLSSVLARMRGKCDRLAGECRYCEKIFAHAPHGYELAGERYHCHGSP